MPTPEDTAPHSAAPYSAAPYTPTPAAFDPSTATAPYPDYPPPQQDYGYPGRQYQLEPASYPGPNMPTDVGAVAEFRTTTADDSAHDVMWRRVTLSIAAVLLVISSVATTLFVTSDSDSDIDSAVSVAPGPAGPTVDIANRSTDPDPLTVEEVFPTPALQLGRVRYDVLAKEKVTGCAETVTGNAATKLRSLDCTQLVRATISDPDRKFLITAGILNLASTEDVNAVADVLRAEGGGNFDMIVPTNMTVNAARARPLHFSRNGHYLTFTTGVPIEGPADENIFENAQLAQALNITRVLTANALERRQLGAAVRD